MYRGHGAAATVHGGTAFARGFAGGAGFAGGRLGSGAAAAAQPSAPWTVHDGQFFAQHVLADAGRAPSNGKLPLANGGGGGDRGGGGLGEAGGGSVRGRGEVAAAVHDCSTCNRLTKRAGALPFARRCLHAVRTMRTMHVGWGPRRSGGGV